MTSRVSFKLAFLSLCHPFLEAVRWKETMAKKAQPFEGEVANV